MNVRWNPWKGEIPLKRYDGLKPAIVPLFESDPEDKEIKVKKTPFKKYDKESPKHEKGESKRYEKLEEKKEKKGKKPCKKV